MQLNITDMATILIIIMSAIAFWNFILRRMYKHRSEMFEAEVKRLHKRKIKVELNHLERQN